MMRLFLSLVIVAGVAAEDRRPIWLAVGPPRLIEAIEPLARHRRAEGLETIISAKSVEAALSSAPRRPTFLLLVGDDQPGEEGQFWCLPTKHRQLYRWRASQAEEFAADAQWGDVDQDLIPDFAVGRIPARSRDDVERVVKKILAFETRQTTPDDLRLVIWSGSPAYGPVIDGMATGVLLGALQSFTPRWAEPWVISADPNHALCGWPPDQPERFAASLAGNGVFGILMGHSSAENFLSMQHGVESIGFTTAHAKRYFSDAPPAPPVVLFACDAGKFDADRPCLAETMLLSSGGPVAVIAATTESHPLTNYYSGFALLGALSKQQDRLGLMWLAAQRRAAKDRNLLIERLLRDVEGKLEERIDIPKLRRDQMLMYALLGDPATRVRLPRPLEASIKRTADGWTWSAVRPQGATRLWVGFRSPDLRMPVSTAVHQSNAEAARAAFKEANQRFKYVEIAPPGSDEPWRGTIKQSGLLRLVVTGPGILRAAVLVAE